VLILDAPNLPARGYTGKQRVFAGIFEISPITRITHQIHGAGEQDVESFVARFASNHCPAGICDFWVPRRGRCQARRKRRRVSRGAPHRRVRRWHDGRGDADAGVGFLQIRNTEARDTAHESRRT